MALPSDDHIPVVGFAREPAVEVRRWFGRIFLLLVIILLGFVLVTRVLSPDDDRRNVVTEESELPGPR